MKVQNYAEYELTTLSALKGCDFYWTPAAKATLLPELAENFKPRLSPDAQIRAFAKDKSCIQILDTILILPKIASKKI